MKNDERYEIAKHAIDDANAHMKLGTAIPKIIAIILFMFYFVILGFMLTSCSSDKKEIELLDNYMGSIVLDKSHYKNGNGISSTRFLLYGEKDTVYKISLKHMMRFKLNGASPRYEILNLYITKYDYDRFNIGDTVK